MKRQQLTTDILECPYCTSDNVEVRQMGHYKDTPMLICFACQRGANFVSPQVIWTPELQKQKVRTDFSPEPAF